MGWHVWNMHTCYTWRMTDLTRPDVLRRTDAAYAWVTPTRLLLSTSMIWSFTWILTDRHTQTHIHRHRHAGIYLRPSDIGCQYSRPIYTARFIVWQPRRAADTSTNWRQSLFCYCTASMKQATDGAETATIDVSSWSENISVSFCLWAPGSELTLWCALGLLVGAQYKCLSYSYSTMM